MLAPASAGDVAAVGGSDVVLVEPGPVLAGVVDPAPLRELVPGYARREVAVPGRVDSRAARVDVALQVERAQIAARRVARRERPDDVRGDVAALEVPLDASADGRAPAGARPRKRHELAVILDL